MDSSNIEQIAINKVIDLVLKNNEFLSPHINFDDKIPLWDGSIYIYNKSSKTNSSFEGRIDVQVKGRVVKKFKDNNTYQFKIETLKNYQKEIKGTLLLIVDFINIDKYKIYYCNLLPVDLYQILKEVKEGQKTISLKLKEINETGVLNLKNVCINFYKNSIRQANKKIIEVSEFNNIEELNFEIFASPSEYVEYLETADVYTYARLKNTNEEVATVKGEWKQFSKVKSNIVVNGKRFYSQYIIIGKEQKELIVGPFKMELLNGECLGLIKITSIDNYVKQLEYFKKIVKLFKFFNTEFDIDYDQLNEVDLKNLHSLMNLFDGTFPNNIKEFKKYYIKINKYKFIFVLVFKEKKLYNFYSQEIIDNIFCVTIKDNKKIKTSIYANLIPEEYVNVSNFNEKILLKSFKNIELTDELLESINLLMLSFIKTYDQSSDRMYLNIADKLNQIICKNRTSDIDLINSKQIKYRKNNLSYNDKKLLKAIGEKEEYKRDYQLLCCIDILINNEFEFAKHYKSMNDECKKIFNEWPIYNLIKK